MSSFKFTGMAALALAAGLAVSPVPSMAQTSPQPEATPLEFARGKRSVTVSESVRGDNGRSYSLKLQAGQDFVAELKSGKAYMNVVGPDGETLFNGSISGGAYKAVAPTTGTYRIEVYLMRNEARRGTVAPFALTVSPRVPGQ